MGRAGAYARLGFDAVADEVFKSLVLARIVEPTSKADTIRVLDEIGVAAPALRTIWRALARCVEREGGYLDDLLHEEGGPALVVKRIR